MKANKKECAEFNNLGVVINDGAAAISKLDSLVEKAVKMDRGGRWALADLFLLKMRDVCGAGLSDNVYVNDEATARKLAVSLVANGMRLSPARVSQYALTAAVFGVDRSERYADGSFMAYAAAASALYKELGSGCTECSKSVRMAALRSASAKLKSRRPKCGASKTGEDKADEWIAKCTAVVAEFSSMLADESTPPGTLLQFVSEAGGVVKMRNEAARILGSRSSK